MIQQSFSVDELAAPLGAFQNLMQTVLIITVTGGLH